jgi:2-iminobutanoate/2-iminopropanoate deaminase
VELHICQIKPQIAKMIYNTAGPFHALRLKFVQTSNAPTPLGPYSQCVVANGFVFISSMAGIDPATGNVVPGGIKEQTSRTLESIKAILEKADSSLQKVTRVVVYLKHASTFNEMNEVYSQYFGDHKPARTTIVTNLVREDFLVAMDATAVT